MKVAKFVKDVSSNFNGIAGLFKLEPGVECNEYNENCEKISYTTNYVIASSVFVSGKQETLIFPADEKGVIKSWLEITRVSTISFEEAFNNLGYEINWG
jgi:hypothetical protein